MQRRSYLTSYAFGGIVAGVQIGLLKFDTGVKLLHFKQEMALGILILLQMTTCVLTRGCETDIFQKKH